jgi:hypothetical protein
MSINSEQYTEANNTDIVALVARLAANGTLANILAQTGSVEAAAEAIESLNDVKMPKAVEYSRIHGLEVLWASLPAGSDYRLGMKEKIIKLYGLLSRINHEYTPEDIVEIMTAVINKHTKQKGFAESLINLLEVYIDICSTQDLKVFILNMRSVYCELSNFNGVNALSFYNTLQESVFTGNANISKFMLDNLGLFGRFKTSDTFVTDINNFALWCKSNDCWDEKTCLDFVADTLSSTIYSGALFGEHIKIVNASLVKLNSYNKIKINNGALVIELKKNFDLNKYMNLSGKYLYELDTLFRVLEGGLVAHQSEEWSSLASDIQFMQIRFGDDSIRRIATTHGTYNSILSDLIDPKRYYYALLLATNSCVIVNGNIDAKWIAEYLCQDKTNYHIQSNGQSIFRDPELIKKPAAVKLLKEYYDIGCSTESLSCLDFNFLNNRYNFDIIKILIENGYKPENITTFYSLISNKSIILDDRHLNNIKNILIRLSKPINFPNQYDALQRLLQL